MKVLMIAPQPFFQPRGTPISVLHRLNTLSKLGHSIDLVTYHLGENIPIKNVTYHRMINLPFVKKIKIGPSKTKIFLDLFIILKTVQLLLSKKYDMIHSHEEAGFFATKLAKWFNLPHLYDMHSSLPQQLTNFKFTKLKPLIRFFENLEANTVTSAAAVITICPELYNYVNEHFPQVKQMLIENVADNSTVFGNEPAPDLSMKQAHGVNGEMVILYSGTFEPYQGIDLLIDSGSAVVSKYQNVRFVLVGGHHDQISAYKEKVASAKLQQFFIFAGQVQPNMVPQYLAAADILVTPRLAGNNTPLKIYEYLRAGKPIVATNHITHTQVLSDDVAVLTDINADAFAKGILKVIEDKNYRIKISENAKKLAEEKYSYAAYINKTKSIYHVIEEKIERREGE
jgi:glycosyltransferase involved in cell wall biosynthesis